jgi:L-lactate utilization protein LutC
MIAFNGGIMVNENQTKGLKINDMPKYHIILGKTSQLVENLSAAMTRVNQLYRENRPMHISTLRGPQDEQVKLASADPNKGRVLLLLLIEDSL